MSSKIRIIGLMSGTSADGVDVAVVDLQSPVAATRLRLVAFETVPYAPQTRHLILSYLNAHNISAAEISQLNFLIGELFADAVLATCRRHRIPLRSVNLIGSHGQTVYHQSVKSAFGGRRISSTLQLGEAAVIAERTGITTISDFRVRDMAAGGNGAPLLPYVDYILLRHPRKHRIALNIGGIANLTFLPRHCRREQLLAFDTGPGNMMLDAALTLRSRGKLKWDKGGRIASRGQVNAPLLTALLEHPFYRQRPPKAAGREQFGIEYTVETLRRLKSEPVENVLATLTELTAQTIVNAIGRYLPTGKSLDELIVSGGGAKNIFLMSRLQSLLPCARVVTATEMGIDSDAKEAIAFAILAHETWRHRPANVPSVTGARHPVVLGKITPA